MQAMIDGGLASARVVSEDWIDTGSPADLLPRIGCCWRSNYDARHESSSPRGLVCGAAPPERVDHRQPGPAATPS
jgi:hypothetical protein